MKKITLLLFCVTSGLAACKKQKSVTPETKTNASGTLGNQMVGTWSLDSAVMYDVSTNEIIDVSYAGTSQMTIEFQSGSTYKETIVSGQSTSISSFVLDESTHTFQYMPVSSTSTVITVLNVNASNMVYGRLSEGVRLYFSK